jgi:putative ABC transport system permease protein
MLPWEDLATHRQTYCFLLGFDAPGDFVTDREIAANWPNLRSSHDILMDAWSVPYVGRTYIGTDAELNGNRVTVTGRFHLGQFFYGEGSAIVTNGNFEHLADRSGREMSIGLLRLNPGVSPSQAKRVLQRLMPPHAVVMTRDQLLSEERSYFLSTKPVGIMLLTSMLIACAVAAAIVAQVLSADIANRLGEYAVIKAIGAEPYFVFGLALSQAFVLSCAGLLGALVVGGIVLEIIEWRTHLGVGLNFLTVAVTVAVTIGLAAAAGGVTARAIERADPADLY